MTEPAAWVMDDDIVPEPPCLAALSETASDRPAAAFAAIRSVQPDRSVGQWGSWCGFLIAREVVGTVGLPREELFWWAEDTEYCHWRLPRAGFPLRFVEAAVVRPHSQEVAARVKYYYEAGAVSWRSGTGWAGMDETFFDWWAGPSFGRGTIVSAAWQQ